MKRPSLGQHYHCQGCQEGFSLTRVPRLLPVCGHTLCQNCITQRLVPNSQGGASLTCLLDDKTMDFEDQDLDNFPKNFAMLKAMEKKQNQVKTEPSQSLKVGKTTNDLQKRVSLRTEKSEHPPLPKARQARHQPSKPTPIKEEPNVQPQENSSVSSSVLQQPNYDEMCLIHSRPLEIVCIKDATMICSNCALFGDHRGHMFKSLIDIKKDIITKQQEFLLVIDEKQQIYSGIQDQVGKAIIDRMLTSKKQILSKQIQQYFDNLIKRLKLQQKKLNTRLGEVVSNLASTFGDDAENVRKGFNQFKVWERGALNCINIMEGEDIEQKLVVLGYEASKSHVDPIDQGYRIIDDVVRIKEDVVAKWKATLSRFCIDFRQAETDKLCGLVGVEYPIPEEEEILTVKSINKSVQTKEQEASKQSNNQGKLPQLKILGTNDDLLIDMENRFQQELHIDNMDFETSMVTDFTAMVELPDISQIEPRGDSFYQSQRGFADYKYPSVVPKSPSSQSRQGEKSFEPRRKTKAVKVPPKYEKMMEGLTNDTIQLLDFTNSQLGNQDISLILDNLRAKKVRNVKLIRCKLTDDILPELWNSMGKIISLNLSQNNFSDRIIDSFLDNIDKLPCLKSLTLSQNKINQRNVKFRLEEARKYDVTISL